MEKSWQLQDAKNRFSELVETALQRGPQTVTRRGEPTVVVISVDDFEKLNPQKSLFDWLRGCPSLGDEFADQIEQRAHDTPRNFEFET
ncbi:MAG: type II toxin-antitoxin system Phd/YefM family antitoxin [Verrucomicrobiota bacterium]